MKSNSWREKNQEKEKKGADEARGEQMKERENNFISEKVVALMERSLKDRALLPKEDSKRLSLPLLKCGVPRARPDPNGEAEPKPRGRPFNSFILHFIKFSFSKVS